MPLLPRVFCRAWLQDLIRITLLSYFNEIPPSLWIFARGASREVMVTDMLLLLEEAVLSCTVVSFLLDPGHKVLD